MRAVPLQSIESKLGKTGESEIAERKPGERPPSQLPLGFCLCFFFARFALFPQCSHGHPEGLLAGYLRSRPCPCRYLVHRFVVCRHFIDSYVGGCFKAMFLVGILLTEPLKTRT